MRRYTKLAMLLLGLALLCSCHRRPLLDLEYVHYVRVYLNEDLKNVTTGFYNQNHKKPEYKTPTVVRVILCDPSTNHVVAERYLQNPGSDERGNYLDGYISAAPGRYKLMAYSFGTESTIIRNEHYFHQAEAYTNEISSYLYGNFNGKGRDADEKIVYDPDHLFVDTYEDLTIGYNSEIDTLYNSNGDHFTANSIVKTYYINVTVEGAQYISSAVALLNGMGGSSLLHNGATPNHQPVTIYFDMIKEGNEADLLTAAAEEEQEPSASVTMYSSFGTFGKLEGEASELEMTFDVITTDGRKLSFRRDITEKFYESNAVNNQWILVTETIVIPPPGPDDPNTGTGGFIPSVEEWKELETEIII